MPVAWGYRWSTVGIMISVAHSGTKQNIEIDRE